VEEIGVEKEILSIIEKKMKNPYPQEPHEKGNERVKKFLENLRELVDKYGRKVKIKTMDLLLDWEVEMEPYTEGFFITSHCRRGLRTYVNGVEDLDPNEKWMIWNFLVAPSKFKIEIKDEKEE
jgi:hypothetical protein